MKLQEKDFESNGRIAFSDHFFYDLKTNFFIAYRSIVWVYYKDGEIVIRTINGKKFRTRIDNDNLEALLEAYVAFCNQPQIVGFSLSMIDVRRNDTNPGTWNADIVNLPSGENVALCFMPINSEALAARIIGIVLGNAGDKYYYMLSKDGKAFSDVMQNKAMLGIEKVGSVKGLGVELMNSFVECIKNSY